MIQLTLKKVAAGVILVMWLAVRTDGKTRSNGPPAGSLVEAILEIPLAKADLSWEAADDSPSSMFSHLPAPKIDEDVRDELHRLGVLYGLIVRPDSVLTDPYAFLPIIVQGDDSSEEQIRFFNELTGDSILTFHYFSKAVAGTDVLIVKEATTDRSSMPSWAKITDSTWEQGPDMQLSTVKSLLRPLAGAFDATNRAYVTHMRSHYNRDRHLTPAQRQELRDIVNGLEVNYTQCLLAVNGKERREANEKLFGIYLRALRWDKNRHE